ncbi:MAG: type I 3-dehydroquinate dehydratase [Syntrophales bacterium]
MICIPIMAGTEKEALALMEKCSRIADILELRWDQIENADLKNLMKARKCRVIVTHRKREEGGSFPGSEKERVDILKEAVALGADLVDIELSTAEPLIAELRDKIRAAGGRTQLIVSYHNFRETPSEADLRAKADACIRAGADIIKIAVRAVRPQDNLRVLGLIPYGLARKRGVIAFCMGEMGRISRIAAPLFGSFLSYASMQKGAESAPGQLTAEEMRRVLRILQR